MIEVIPALRKHTASIVCHLRDDDRREVECFAPVAPDVLLRLSIELSAECWTALEDGRPIAAWGVVAQSLVGRGIGYPWMLTTSAVEHHRIRLVRDSRAWVRKLLQTYSRLEAVVDPRYTRALQWLRRMGFTVLDGAPLATVYIEAGKWV